MGRNVKNVEQGVFAKIDREITGENRNLITGNKKGLFLTEKEYDVIEHAKIKPITLGNDSSMAVIDYDDKRFICVPQNEYSDGFFENMEEISENPDENSEIINGIGILLLYYNVINLKKDMVESRIISEIMGISEDVIFNCGELLDKFEDYRICPVGENSFKIKYTEDAKRLLCALICKKNDKCDLYKAIYDFVMLESSRSVIDIIYSVTELRNEEIIFLQLYRALEYLFAINRADKCSNTYGIDINKVVDLIVGESLRFPEESSVRALIEKCSSSIAKKEYCDYIEKLTGVQIKEDKTDEVLSKYIYEQRCKIAHFKYKHEPIKDIKTLSESNIYLIRLIQSIFESMETKIIAINEANNLWEEFKTQISFSA